ncbi:NAD(P)H-hydrate dehydratase [uncultured Psychrobacter sp.]|uniref:NAD(P)H-hydrate dehydratase n=1 Tax=uncultured Psychrobacter sp. TaxID=259303 RepID=UPI003458A469
MLPKIPTTAYQYRPSIPIALYSSDQVYTMEQDWFAQGYSGFALMKQAAWQIAQHIIQLNEHSIKSKDAHNCQSSTSQKLRACVWVGQGNNGGDGWLIAYYLQQVGWHVQIITVGITDLKGDIQAKNVDDTSLSDALKAQQIALAAHCPYQRFEDSQYYQNENAQLDMALQADVYIDALFGIGLDRAPKGVYQQAIIAFNKLAKQTGALVVAVDIPSGLVASTGQIFEQLAIQADFTLCLVARKFGLHTKDGADYAGQVIDIPLIPYEPIQPAAWLLNRTYCLSSRQKNSYKGSYGHVLIIGGNRIDGSQGMGGAAILSSASSMATGAGKITVACHDAFHGALLTSLPDAMTIDLHDQGGVKNLIKDASVIAIGMGLGRDNAAKELFISYVQAAIEQKCTIVIDADGLYHLASLYKDNHKLINSLREHSRKHRVCLTPHSGEAARLLDLSINEVENGRLAAIKQCADLYGGDWVLKGSGSLVSEQGQVYVCNVGNAGMATAGMGDVLSGVTAGLLAQQDLDNEQRSLRQAVLIHGLAGDQLTNQSNSAINSKLLLIGQRGLQAQDMPAAIRHVMQMYTH